MSDQPAKDPAARTGLRSLVTRIVQGVARNKGLFLSVVVAAMLAAFFTKAPFLLVHPLLEAFEGTVDPLEDGWWFSPEDPAVPLEDMTERFKRTMEEQLVAVARTLSGWIGVEFEGSPVEQRRKQIIVAAPVLAILSGLIGAVALYFSLYLSRYFATRIVVDLRNEVADHILRLPLRFFGRRKIGDLISNLTNDTSVLSRSFMLVADHAVTDPMLVMANMALIWVIAPELLWVFIPAVPLMALPMIRLGRRVRRRSSRSLEAMGDSTESMNQMLSGIKTVKAFQLEDQRIAEFRDVNELYLHRTKRMLQTKGRSQSFVYVGYQFAFAAILLILGWLVLNEIKTVAEIATILVPVSTTYTHVKRLSRAYNTMMESLGALERIESVLYERPDQTAGDGAPVTALRGEVEFDGVSFAYGDEPVVRNVSFRAEPGQTIALVGPSGAGKSTCIDLLARFYDPVEGRILIDGRDLRELDVGDYRRHVAMVTQQPFLFNASILDNIRFGKPDATMEEVEAAARAADIHDFISALPNGYDTIAGERSSNVSGGQMQRITIARALLRDPEILLLDEAMSALDSESEEAVQTALTRLRAGRTSFVIAHRLATIRDADRIVVMDAGRVVEQGLHDDLLGRNGLYQRLVNLQDMR